MKFVPTLVLLAVLAASSPAKAGDVTGVSFGNHSKATAPPSERDQIGRFYRYVLGSRVTATSPTMDLIRLGDNFYIAIEYKESALNEPDMTKSIWLELRTDNPEALASKILSFGIKPMETHDKAHFTFQAPGGQVFRLVDNTEDLSRYER